MATNVNNKCKAFTSMEQSKRLAEILPLESADMYYACGAITPDIMIGSKQDYRCYTMCWSLVALLGVLPNYQLQTQDDGIGVICSCNGKFNIVTANNPVDACVAMIEKLNELNLL